MERLHVIEEIMSVERRARQIADAARARRAEFERKLESECENVRSELWERANLRLDMVRDIERTRADEEIKELEKRLKPDLEALESGYRKNRANTLDTLLRSIIGF